MLYFLLISLAIAAILAQAHDPIMWRALLAEAWFEVELDLDNHETDYTTLDQLVTNISYVEHELRLDRNASSAIARFGEFEAHPTDTTPPTREQWCVQAQEVDLNAFARAIHLEQQLDAFFVGSTEARALGYGWAPSYDEYVHRQEVDTALDGLMLVGRGWVDSAPSA